jgi:hypothetical protein
MAFGLSDMTHRVEVVAADDFVVDAGFTDHPLLGHYREQLRYVRGTAHDYAAEFIRKDDPLAPSDVAERVAFLRGFAPASPFAAPVPELTPFATGARRRSERLRDLVLDASAAGTGAAPGSRSVMQSMPSDQLGALLIGASPFHYREVWANIARFYGRNVVDDGLVDDFETAVACERAAVWILHDARADPFLHRLLYEVAENLADVLMLTRGDSRRSNVARAATLYFALAHEWRLSEAKRAFHAEIMAGVAMVLQDPDSTTPFAARLSPNTRQAVTVPAVALAAFEHLMGYSNRMSYIARRTSRALHYDACLAADIAQVLVEAVYGSEPDFTTGVGRVAQAFQRQLDCQLGVWGLTQADLDCSAAALGARFRQSPESHPQLVLLRPLATVRRLRMENRFGPYYRDVISAIVPTTLTLESALHLAFMKHFDTVALGGPIDIFGMARSTALGTFRRDVESWHTAVQSLIQTAALVLALFDETEALYWEMEELARQRAFGKVIFVLPPAADRRSPALRTAAIERLRSVGLQLQEDAQEPGFILFDGSGAVAQRLPFDALWSGELLETVTRPR